MKYAKLIIFSVICLMVGGAVFFTGFAMNGFDIDRLSTEGEFFSRSYTESAAVTAIEIHDNDAKIEFVATNSDQIYITYNETNLKTYSIENHDSVLTMTGNDQRKWYHHIFNLSFKTPVITVYIPRDMQVSVTTETANADILAKDLTFQSLSFATSNSEIELDGVNVLKDCTLQTANASVLLEHVVINGALTAGTSNDAIETNQVQADTVSLGTTNGNIEFENLFANNSIHLSTTNDDIEGTVADSIRSFNIQSSTTNGENNLPVSLSGGEKQLSVNTTNGDIDIMFLQ